MASCASTQSPYPTEVTDAVDAVNNFYDAVKNKNVDSRIEIKSTQTESQNSLINKLISPHLINKSIISFNCFI